MCGENMLEKVKRSLLCMQRLSWEQGCAAQAFFEIGDIETGVLLAREAVRRQLPDGRLGILSDLYICADPGACGEPVLMAARHTGDKQFLEAAKRMEDYFFTKAPRTAEGVVTLASGQGTQWSKKAKQDIVIDALYHVAPFLAAIGNYAEAINQLIGCRKILFDHETELYYQVWEKESNKRFSRWGAGMGWMAGAYARVIDMLPGEMSEEKNLLAGYLRELLDGVLVWQREDGLFHDIIDDKETYYEAVAAEMLGYAIYRGIRVGVLPGTYEKYAEKMRNGIHGMVNSNGIVCNQYGIPQFAAEGNAFFILLEAARNDLARA